MVQITWLNYSFYIVFKQYLIRLYKGYRAVKVLYSSISYFHRIIESTTLSQFLEDEDAILIFRMSSYFRGLTLIHYKQEINIWVNRKSLTGSGTFSSVYICRPPTAVTAERCLADVFSQKPQNFSLAFFPLQAQRGTNYTPYIPR